MKQIMKNNAAAWAVLAIGVAIIVAGILTMALYHDISWQSYLIIGIIMLCALWGMVNLPITVSLKQKFVPVRSRNRHRQP